MKQAPLPRRAALALLAATALAGGVAPAQAQAPAWPSKPIRLVVNFPPGGAADQLARALAQPLQEVLGQPVTVDNRGGAGGNVGGDVVAKAPADGHTLLFSSGGMVSVNPHIYPRMPFDPVKDLQPVAAAARVLVYLVVRADSPVKDFKGLVADLKAHPGKRTYGSPGNGSSPHLAGEMMKSMSGSFAVHIPYRGAAPALTDLLGGQVDYLFDPGIAMPHIRSGKLRLLAVGSPQRSPLFPDVPTVAEAGLKGFDADTVFGVYAPAGTPAPVVARLNAEINRLLATPAVRERITAIGGVATPMSVAEFGQRMAEDSKRFAAIIRERKIVGD
ncbi:MAG: tripartite tricarboxylate transporter substrate binding protein [Burkholderiaceae bacterium]|nr:tripartite tricarboxylate transporter substrate binding protein [Burkholderiaceae bacterium]